MTALARVTISAPQRRMDVALPELVPLVELLPELLRHAGDGLADDGEQHGGWVLRRADGSPLSAAANLAQQGVRDGEMLHLLPAQTDWPELEYDDVVEAIAAGARRQGTAWSGSTTRTATLAVAGVLLHVGVLAILRGGPAWTNGAVAGLAVAVLLTLIGTAASRAYGDASAGTALGGYALPYAFVGGALLLASPDAAGPLAPVAWLGAPELLVGSVALLLAGVLSGIGVGTGRPVFVGGVTVGLLGALTALAGFFLTAAGAAAVLLCVLVCGIGVLPLLAIRFGRLPMPPLVLPIHAEEPAAFTGAEPGTEPTGLDGARERPDRGRVFAAVARTEELLTGMVIGYGVLAVGGSLVLVLSGGSAGRLLVAVAAAALCLRSRLFVGVRQRVPLLTAGMTGFAALAVDVLRRADEPALLALTGGALVAAVVAIAAGGTYSRRPPSPYLGRAADAVDALMVISVVPVACAVLGLYARVRGLTG